MLIVATAGHIDHGKTSLVRALTGVDTDKLPEERARGISIDLGFAYWQAAPDSLVAFVDVPGHQRFIRNMLAGVAAVHFAMVVVAVDDGPMPQTEEHVRILDFLGVRQGVVVLSKADTAGAERIAEVMAATRALLEGTTLEGIPMLAVSARDGTGIPQLQALLAEAARAHEQRAGQERSVQRRTRMAIDRVFSVRGAGTVATGTLYDGRLAREDHLRVGLDPIDVRVRGIQVHGHEMPQARSGERAAVNLAGADTAQLSRGDWLTHGELRGSNLLDVRLSLLPGAAPLRHAGRARFYLGASELVCRVLLQGKGPLEPGFSVPARLLLEGDVPAVNGDRFVLRDGPATTTIGGGLVVDPSPGSRRKFLSPEEFEALAAGEPAAALAVMLQAAVAAGRTGVELSRFVRIFNLADGARDAALRSHDTVLLSKARPLVVTRAEFDTLTARTGAALRQDERVAVRISELRHAVAPGLPAEAFESFLRTQAEALDISLAGGAVTLRERRDSARGADHAAWERVRPLLERAGLQPPDLAGLAAASGIAAGRLRAILYAQSRAGEVFVLQPDKYLVRDLVARLAAAAAVTAAAQPGGLFTAAQYRDTVGTGRTLAIHVLEMLDAAGITRRSGDQRVVVRQPEDVFGGPLLPFKADTPPQQPPTKKAGPARPGAPPARRMR